MTRDRYSSFVDLKRDKVEGLDYLIRCTDRDSGILIMAPHGGRIERHTAELAEEIAGEDFSFYCFVGIQPKNNLRDLHVASHLFDEERALEMAGNARSVVTVHGQRDRDAEFVMLGGRDDRLGRRLAKALSDGGFRLRKATRGLAGTDVDNICNRGMSGAGLQIEISRALREGLASEPNRRAHFVRLVQATLAEFG